MSSVTRTTTRSPEVTDERQAEQHKARRTLWKESRVKRLRNCGYALAKHGDNDGLSVKVKYSDGVAGFSGTQTCGSVWGCPCCSQKIMAHRAGEVQQAVDAWHDVRVRTDNRPHGRVIFLTLTMRHHLGQSLNELMDAGTYAFQKVRSGRGWEKDSELYGSYLPRTVKTGKNAGQVQYGFRIPYIRAMETTRTYKNGWHVHFHILLFVKDGITDDEVALFGQSIYGRWANALVAKGLTSPTPRNGIDTKLVRRSSTANALGDYFTKHTYVGRIKEDKAGYEVAYNAGKGGDFKDPYTGRQVEKGRTPFGILADVVELGDADDLDLWHEWEQASKGRRQLTWSVGIRDLLGIGDEETDESIAEKDLGGEVVMEFEIYEWEWLRWYSDRILKLVRDGVRDKKLLLHIVQAHIERQQQLAA